MPLLYQPAMKKKMMMEKCAFNWMCRAHIFFVQFIADWWCASTKHCLEEKLLYRQFSWKKRYFIKFCEPKATMCNNVPIVNNTSKYFNLDYWRTHNHSTATKYSAKIPRLILDWIDKIKNQIYVSFRFFVN